MLGSILHIFRKQLWFPYDETLSTMADSMPSQRGAFETQLKLRISAALSTRYNQLRNYTVHVRPTL
jgi:hypothetical protein